MKPVQKMLPILSALILAGQTAMATDPWEKALKLRVEALIALKTGNLAATAGLYYDAYHVAPDPCSARTLMLLSETVEANVRASSKIGGDSLCRIEGLVEVAIANPACAANLEGLAALTKDLQKARRRLGSECSTVIPVLRALSEYTPLAVEAPSHAPPTLDPEPIPTTTARVVRSETRGPRVMAAGGVILGAGVGLAVVSLVGLVRGVRLEQQATTKVNAGDAGCNIDLGLSGGCAALSHDGQNMNRLATGAGIAAAALIISGAILVATGARLRRNGRNHVVAIQGSGFHLRF